MTGRGKSMVVGAALVLGLTLGCSGGGGGSGSCGSSTTVNQVPEVSSCTPMTVKAGTSVEIFGSNLPGMDAVVTFKSGSKSETGHVNIGDSGSIDVTVPSDLSGTVTVMLCGLSCTITVTPATGT